MKNKKAVILGGTSGIGLAAATQLAEKGVKIIAASRRSIPDIKIPGVTFDTVDVLDRNGLLEFFEKHGPIDYLVNAATGGPRAIGPFMDMDLDGFQASFAKLWGYTNSVHIGGRYINKNGAIVLVSGYPARRCRPGAIAISTVGNAVEGFVRGVAPELAPIRINAVSPGLIDTPMFAQEGDDRQQFFDDTTAGHLIPRAGTPDEVAKGIVFAIENDFVTGTTVDVDGGALLAK